MRGAASPGQRAIELMREAIILLDKAGEGLSAIHLQAAIDATGRGRSTGSEGETMGANGGAAPIEQLEADPALVRAIGGALAVMATIMARQGSATVGEVARLLGIYAVVTKEASPQEGLIIACWSAILGDAAEALAGGDISGG